MSYNRKETLLRISENLLMAALAGKGRLTEKQIEHAVHSASVALSKIDNKLEFFTYLDILDELKEEYHAKSE